MAVQLLVTLGLSPQAGDVARPRAATLSGGTEGTHHRPGSEEEEGEEVGCGARWEYRQERHGDVWLRGRGSGAVERP